MAIVKVEFDIGEDSTFYAIEVLEDALAAYRDEVANGNMEWHKRHAHMAQLLLDTLKVKVE